MLLINSLIIFKLKLLRPGPEATLHSETCDPQLGQLRSAPGEAPSRLTALPKGLEAAWAGGQRVGWLTFASDLKPRLQTPYSILFFPSIPVFPARRTGVGSVLAFLYFQMKKIKATASSSDSCGRRTSC